MAEIRTTHMGSLHRPPALVEMVSAREAGETVPGIEAAEREAVLAVVAEQVGAGIEVVNDGEQGKRTYVSYIIERLTGFADGAGEQPRLKDLEAFPDFADVVARLEAMGPPRRLPACVGPIAVSDPDAVVRDVANLAAAAAAAGIPRDRVFMSAISPGTVAATLENQYYPTTEEYLAALGDALRHEYRTIVEAGFTLQIDTPDFAMRQGDRKADPTLDEIRTDVARSVEALNAAVADLPPEQMRVHVCWGNREMPHVHDVALADILDVIVKARPSGIAVEAANPRHGHEWQVFESFTLPDDKYLLPGVIDTTTNFVEHPRLVAQRLGKYTNLLGNERVVAATDCGFGTHAGRNRVSRSVAWAKLESMVEGAAIASR